MTSDPLREALKGASAGIARAEIAQAELFELPCADPTGEIAQAQARNAKGGRPKGAQNLATRELREFLLTRMGGQTPQEQVARWAALGPEGLAKALGVSRADGFDRWQRMQEWLGRFFMPPMVPVDADGKPAPSIVVSIGGATGVTTSSGEVLPPWSYVEQDQEVIDGFAEPSQNTEPKE